MKLFKNPVFAVVLAVVVVIASTLINTNIKFGRRCSAVSDMFYEGVAIKGYTQTPIATHLENIAAYADGLCTIARNYGLDTAETESVSQYLRWSLEGSYSSISYVHSNYTELNSALSALIDSLERADLSERDASGVAQYKSSIEGAQSAIGESGYNEVVRGFLRQYRHFPTELLAALAGVDYPELFA